MQRLAVTCMLDHVRLLLETYCIFFLWFLMRDAKTFLTCTSKHRSFAAL